MHKTPQFTEPTSKIQFFSKCFCQISKSGLEPPITTHQHLCDYSQMQSNLPLPFSLRFKQEEKCSPTNFRKENSSLSALFHRLTWSGLSATQGVDRTEHRQHPAAFTLIQCYVIDSAVARWLESWANLNFWPRNSHKPFHVLYKEW